MSLIGYALRTAKEYYEPKTYDHVIRVASYVADNPMIPDDKMDVCIALAIMHDLREDTKWTGWFGSEHKHFDECLDIITKPRNIDYIEYIRKIRLHSNTHPEAFWVKMADMKDHLTQVDTLTDKLKEKYLRALPYLF